MIRATDLSLNEQISLLSGSDVWHTRDLPDHAVPAVMLSDGPHGLRKQDQAGDHLGVSGSNPATCFPTAVTLASSWDEELIAEVGRAVGNEARAEGVGVVLGPGLNIKRHPNCGRNFEYLSEDPLLSGRLAAAMVNGIQQTGVGACLKHFAVNNQEAHRLVVDVVVDDRTLHEIYLAGFEHAVRAARPWTVMAAYNSLNGTYCCDNHDLLTAILRDRWGFDGLVMSDWGATNDRVVGVHAGMDLEMPGSGGISDGDVAAAVASGELPRSDVATSAQRVLDLTQQAPGEQGSAADTVAHHLLCRRAAAESTVLLRNDGILPLDPDISIAVIGAFARAPRFQGFGSSLVNPTSVDSAWDAIRTRAATASYAPGYDPVTSARDDLLIREAVRTARRADVVVLLAGLPGVYESEGFDRSDMALPEQHNALITKVCAANPRTIVALSNGSPVAMPWVDAPAAIVESYLGGQASGSALADVLFGDVDPGGRLAETFPIDQTDVASDPYFPGEPHQVEYRENLLVGYRHFTTNDVPALFPFGYGLSYATFEWGPATADRTELAPGGNVTVSVPITNSGPRPGSDVVQLYVRDITGAVARPLRELRGFAKVHLAPGATQTVTISLDDRAFSYFDADSQRWRVPSGEFVLELAASSVDIRSTITVTVTGQVPGGDCGPVTVARSDQEFAELLGRPVPLPRPVRPFSRLTTVGELQESRVGRVLRMGLHRYTRGQFEQMAAGDSTMVTMLGRALDEMPLRGVALFAGGVIPWSALDALVDVLNGRPLAAGSRSAAAVVRGVSQRLFHR